MSEIETETEDFTQNSPLSGKATRPQLSRIDLDVIHFIERFHASMGETPTDQQIADRYELPKDFLKGFRSNSLVLKSLATRGIIYPAPKDRFTPEQMHAAATMMDYTDRRSDEKKLRDLGISTRQWSAWIQDNQFAQYLSSRSELMLQNSMHEAHKGLVKGVRNGNVASIRTMYEITGRHDPNKEAEVNVQQLLHGFIEVIQRFVKDPITLHAIATEMTNLASRESFSNMVTQSIMNAPSAPQAVSYGTSIQGPSIIPDDLSSDGE